MPGPPAEGDRLLPPLRASGLPLDGQIGPAPYVVLQSSAENLNPPGMRNYWRSEYMTQLSDDAIDLLAEEYSSAPHPQSHLISSTWAEPGAGSARTRRPSVTGMRSTTQ